MADKKRLGPGVAVYISCSYDELALFLEEICKAYFEHAETGAWGAMLRKRIQDAIAQKQLPELRGCGSFSRMGWSSEKGRFVIAFYHNQLKNKSDYDDPDLEPMSRQHQNAIMAALQVLDRHKIRYELSDQQE